MGNNESLCYICSAVVFKKWVVYSDSTSKNYDLFFCPECGLWQILPVPSDKEIRSLYESNYFGKRTARGYNNYLSNEVRNVITSTFQKNLSDLGFFQWESSPECKKKSLEIGSASGHFLRYLSERNWNISGIDISKEMTDAARKAGLNIIHGDFLTTKFNGAFDLVVLWATLEHLPNPRDYLIKIKKLMKKNGHLYLSTANTGFWARIYKNKWRYLNVPEHIFYFNRKNLIILLNQAGLKLNHSFTYGSGFTTKPEGSVIFRIFKKIFDASAKYFHTGDMIVMDIVHDD